MKKENIQDAQHGTPAAHLNFDKPKHAGVALTLNNLVVLAKRIEICPYSKKPPPFAGYWSVFCGTIEEGEDAESAAVREVKEETQLTIDKDGLQFLGQIRGLALFRYELGELELITLDYEHTEYGYFKIPEIHASPDPVDEDIARAIQYNNFIDT